MVVTVGLSLFSRCPPPRASARDGTKSTAAAMVNGTSSTMGSDSTRDTKRRRPDSAGDDEAALAQPTTTTFTPAPGRRCFVTVGATAGFASLLKEVASVGFIQALARHGYGVLEVQCGPDLAFFNTRVARVTDEERRGVVVRSFDYTDEMDKHIIACRGEMDVRPAGCVISHAGGFCDRMFCVVWSNATDGLDQVRALWVRCWVSGRR